MGLKQVRFDDLLGTESEDVTPHTFTVDGVEVDPLDLLPSTFAAVEALLVKRDPELFRELFAPAARTQRTKAEVDEIRKVARENGYEVQDSGRLPRKVVTWYENTYLPEQAAKAEGEGEEETPTPPAPKATRGTRK